MTERPILFSAPMVQALLAGRKTMTRRLVTNRSAARIEVGDVLWVKETWAYFGGDEYLYQREPGAVQYRASADAFDPPAGGRWRPSIFMPRWASRISLLVTGKRVEHAHGITADDVAREGIDALSACQLLAGALGQRGASGEGLCRIGCGDLARVNTGDWSPLDCWRVAWCAINGAESWDANPEVFVFTFEHTEAPARCRCGHDASQHYGDSEARGRPCRECGCLGMESDEATARDVKCPRCYGHGETAWDDTRVIRCGACGGEGKAREGGR